MREKRQHHRAPLQVEVTLQAADGAHFQTQAIDISIGGMFLAGAVPARIGAEVVLFFDMPKLGTVELPAYVRWTAGRGFGVQFGLIGARETHAIGQLVREEAQRSVAAG